MILHNAAELLSLEMNGGSSATLIFIIIILKLIITPVGTYCGPNVIPLLWVTYIAILFMRD